MQYLSVVIGLTIIVILFFTVGIFVVLPMLVGMLFGIWLGFVLGKTSASTILTQDIVKNNTPKEGEQHE